MLFDGCVREGPGSFRADSPSFPSKGQETAGRGLPAVAPESPHHASGRARVWPRGPQRLLCKRGACTLQATGGSQSGHPRGPVYTPPSPFLPPDAPAGLGTVGTGPVAHSDKDAVPVGNLLPVVTEGGARNQSLCVGLKSAVLHGLLDTEPFV